MARATIPRQLRLTIKSLERWGGANFLGPQMTAIKSATAGDPARILVVEDSLGDILLLRHALDQHGEAYKLEVLHDGEEALRFIYDQANSAMEPRPCVMVLDLHLPKHDGVAILEAMRQTPRLAHIHVVAVSSFVSPRDEAEVKSLGVRLYYEKPLELNAWIDLAGKILEICRESAVPVV